MRRIARREREVFRHRDLDRIANHQPAILRARDRALDEEQAAIGVGTHDLEVLLRTLAITHVTGHLLALEYAARILTVTRRTVRAVRDRDTVGGAQTAEAPTLHGASKALTLRVAGDVDLLAGDEVLGRNARADGKQGFLAVHAEFTRPSS